jgi:hypothetical protein
MLPLLEISFLNIQKQLGHQLVKGQGFSMPVAKMENPMKMRPKMKIVSGVIH